MAERQSPVERWETPTQWLCRALRLPERVALALNRYRVPSADLMEQRRAWVMELPTLVVTVLVGITLPVFVLVQSPFLLVWTMIACIACSNYVLVMRGRARLVVTLTLLAATWLPVANLGHAPGQDMMPLSFMGGMFALIVAALLEPVSSTLVYGIMAELALQATATIYGTSPLRPQLSIGVILLTSVAAAGSWATDRAFTTLERALTRNQELGERLRGINATLEATNAELESRVAERTKALEEISVRDELTGLYNRRYFTGEMAARQQERRQCTLLMADVDHFKAVNDTLGHAGGDIVLRRVAEVLRSHLRDEDFVARIGGEEFVVVLTDEDLTTGAALAERLRRSVAEQPWTDIPVPTGRVTMSVGVANTVLSSPQAVQNLMRQADQALYAAKAAGRNRVECGPGPIPAQQGPPR